MLEMEIIEVGEKFGDDLGSLNICWLYIIRMACIIFGIVIVIYNKQAYIL